jgi:putative peptidoglycan lipid II flippase
MSSSLTDPSTANAAPGSAEPIPDILIPDDTTFTVQQEKTNEGVARATGILALGNITSRILGLAREIALTNLFGASAAVDAFKVAILVPKGLFDLLIGGHVNGAIIPVLSEVATKDGRDELWRLVSILLNMLTAALAVLVILLEIGAPVIVRLFGSGFDDYTQALAVNLLRLTSPALIFMGMFAIISGTL